MQKRESALRELKDLQERTKDPMLVKERLGESIRFEDLPLSKKTIDGLRKSNFVEMTEIQSAALPFALCQKDVLGAAKTGSGKTLTFIIPILEILYRQNWNSLDGLGALVISPTRELAIQIFQVLKKVGQCHSFSAGLLIGGKDLKSEQERVQKINILVATPGRLLQHMDETPEFYCDNLQMLVLDEADRILDSGFERDLNAIIENLPQQRQTLLFSATQTKSVKDLARLSLQNPEYISVHEQAEHATPQRLSQKYLVCELEQKLDILYNFIKTHLKTKMIIFLSSCKQVKFVHDTFCKMQPGIQLMCLHGKQKQHKRLVIFEEFCRKKTVCLFATDIAARGLDFPAVDWVLQVDCPDDVDTYIHRVGRTARYDAAGNGLLFLLPSEEKGMIQCFEEKKIPIQQIKVNPEKLRVSVPKLLQSYCFSDPEIKYLGQKAFVSYLRSIFLQKNKQVFDVHQLNIDKFAEALGLPSTPKIKFGKKKKQEPVESQKEENKTPVTKIDRMFNRKNMTVLSEHYQQMIHQSDDSDSEEDFLTLKREDHELDESVLNSGPVPMSKKQILKAKKKGIENRGLGQQFVFDEEGKPVPKYKMESLDEYKSRLMDDLGDEQDILLKAAEKHAEKEREALSIEDRTDKQVQKQRLREKRLMRKLKEKEMNEESSGPVVTLGSVEEESEEEFEMSERDSEQSEEQSSRKRRKIAAETLEDLGADNLEALALQLMEQ